MKRYGSDTARAWFSMLQYAAMAADIIFGGKNFQFRLRGDIARYYFPFENVLYKTYFCRPDYYRPADDSLPCTLIFSRLRWRYRYSHVYLAGATGLATIKCQILRPWHCQIWRLFRWKFHSGREYIKPSPAKRDDVDIPPVSQSLPCLPQQNAIEIEIYTLKFRVGCRWAHFQAFVTPL